MVDREEKNISLNCGVPHTLREPSAHCLKQNGLSSLSFYFLFPKETETSLAKKVSQTCSAEPVAYNFSLEFSCYIFRYFPEGVGGGQTGLKV